MSSVLFWHSSTNVDKWTAEIWILIFHSTPKSFESFQEFTRVYRLSCSYLIEFFSLNISPITATRSDKLKFQALQNQKCLFCVIQLWITSRDYLKMKAYALLLYTLYKIFILLYIRNEKSKSSVGAKKTEKRVKGSYFTYTLICVTMRTRLINECR